MTTRTAEERSKEQARAQMESIVEMVGALDTEDEDDKEEARQAITEDALDVEVRSDWAKPGEPLTATEYKILLCTGGPAVRIIGDLNEHSEPETARLEHQDWGTPWTAYHQANEEILLDYTRCFFFGA